MPGVCSDSRLWALGFGIFGVGFGVWGCGHCVQGAGCRVLVLRVEGLPGSPSRTCAGCRVLVSRVQGGCSARNPKQRCRVEGVGVEGLGLTGFPITDV